MWNCEVCYLSVSHKESLCPTCLFPNRNREICFKCDRPIFNDVCGCLEAPPPRKKKQKIQESKYDLALPFLCDRCGWLTKQKDHKLQCRFCESTLRMDDAIRESGVCAYAVHIDSTYIQKLETDVRLPEIREMIRIGVEHAPEIRNIQNKLLPKPPFSPRMILKVLSSFKDQKVLEPIGVWNFLSNIIKWEKPFYYWAKLTISFDLSDFLELHLLLIELPLPPFAHYYLFEEKFYKSTEFKPLQAFLHFLLKDS